MGRPFDPKVPQAVARGPAAPIHREDASRGVHIPAQVLAPHVPPGPIPRRVVFSVPDHVLKVHGSDVRLNVAQFFVPDVEMQALPPEVPDPLEPRRSLPESEWHRQSVRRVAEHPGLVVNLQDPIVRTWVDSAMSNDGVRLWTRLWSGKHPDVVFQHASGALTVVEVEPDATGPEGFAQVWGDYVISLRVDRHPPAPAVRITGVLSRAALGSGPAGSFPCVVGRECDCDS